MTSRGRTTIVTERGITTALSTLPMFVESLTIALLFVLLVVYSRDRVLAENDLRA